LDLGIYAKYIANIGFNWTPYLAGMNFFPSAICPAQSAGHLADATDGRPREQARASARR
jgi:hypothetical protein